MCARWNAPVMSRRYGSGALRPADTQCRRGPPGPSSTEPALGLPAGGLDPDGCGAGLLPAKLARLQTDGFAALRSNASCSCCEQVTKGNHQQDRPGTQRHHASAWNWSTGLLTAPFRRAPIVIVPARERRGPASSMDSAMRSIQPVVALLGGPTIAVGLTRAALTPAEPARDSVASQETADHTASAGAGRPPARRVHGAQNGRRDRLPGSRPTAAGTQAVRRTTASSPPPAWLLRCALVPTSWAGATAHGQRRSPPIACWMGYSTKLTPSSPAQP